LHERSRIDASFGSTAVPTAISPVGSIGEFVFAGRMIWITISRANPIGIGRFSQIRIPATNRRSVHAQEAKATAHVGTHISAAFPHTKKDDTWLHN
jgi:hypothetical protein